MSLHVFLAVPHDDAVERRLQTRTMHDRGDKHVVTKKSEAFMQMSNQFSPEVNGNRLLASSVIDGRAGDRAYAASKESPRLAKVEKSSISKLINFAICV